MRKLTSIQEKILDKALYLIGKNSSFNIPIRAIAKEANVNVSAINYYFRTKEEMMKYVKDFYLNNTVAAYSALDNEEYSNEEKASIVANEIMEYTIKYPGVLIILREAIKNKDSDEMDAKIANVTEVCGVYGPSIQCQEQTAWFREQASKLSKKLLKLSERLQSRLL